MRSLDAPRATLLADPFAARPGEVFSVTRDVDGRMHAPGGRIERLAGERATSGSWSTIERIVNELTS